MAAVTKGKICGKPLKATARRISPAKEELSDHCLWLAWVFEQIWCLVLRVMCMLKIWSFAKKRGRPCQVSWQDGGEKPNENILISSDLCFFWCFFLNFFFFNFFFGGSYILSFFSVGPQSAEVLFALLQVLAKSSLELGVLRSAWQSFVFGAGPPTLYVLWRFLEDPQLSTLYVLWRFLGTAKTQQKAPRAVYWLVLCKSLQLWPRWDVVGLEFSPFAPP